MGTDHARFVRDIQSGQDFGGMAQWTPGMSMVDEMFNDRLRAKLIGDTVRWAGFDKSGGMIDNTGGFSVTINLNTKQVGDTVDAEYVEL